MLSKSRKLIGVRHGQAFILFGSLVMALLVRVDLSVGIVRMTDLTARDEHEVFSWSPSQKGILLGMFFNGFVPSGLPSGFLTNRCRVRYLLGASNLICGLLALAFPLTTIYVGFTGSCVSRVIQGLVQGVAFPCATSHLAKWASPSERPLFTSLVLSGAAFGTVVAQSAAGLLASGKGGWPSIFYTTGTCSIVWSVICFWFLRDSPMEYKGISKEEKAYIQMNMDSNAEKCTTIPIPWKTILTSAPVWAITTSACSYYWMVWTLDTMLPTYMKAVFQIEIAQNGLLSSLPQLGMFLSCLIIPAIGHYISKYFRMSLTFQRKFWNSIALLGGAVCFLLMCAMTTSSTMAIVTLCIANVLLAGIHLGFKCNIIDLSPNFSAILVGISNGLGQIPPLFAPTLTGFILEYNDDPVSAWSIIYIIAAAISVSGGIIYAIFASAKTQDWNDVGCTERPSAIPS